MLFSVEQAFVGRDEQRAPLKTPAWEATHCLAKCLTYFLDDFLTVMFNSHAPAAI